MEKLQWGFPIATTLSLNKLHINQLEVKVVEVKTRASEAKGPFPGGKRVGSWGNKKHNRKERSPSSEVDELEGLKIIALQRLLIVQLFTLSQCSRGLNPSAGKSSRLKLRACTGLYL